MCDDNEVNLMDRLRHDLRFALRGFRRTPGFFATVVAILALGIGMSVAMFTVFRTVLVRRLPVIDQDRIAVMWTYRYDPLVDYATGTKDLAVVRRESRTMRDIAAVAHWPATESPFKDGDRSVELNRGMATGNFFDVLGVRPALGRLLRPSDDEAPASYPGESHVSRAMVLSYRAWREKFGGDSTVVGRHLVEPLLQMDYTIIGVAPPGLDYPARADYWIPMWSGWESGVSAFAQAARSQFCSPLAHSAHIRRPDAPHASIRRRRFMPTDNTVVILMARSAGGPVFVPRFLPVGARGVTEKQVLRSLRSHQDDGGAMIANALCTSSSVL